METQQVEEPQGQPTPAMKRYQEVLDRLSVVEGRCRQLNRNVLKLTLDLDRIRRELDGKPILPLPEDRGSDPV